MARIVVDGSHVFWTRARQVSLDSCAVDAELLDRLAQLNGVTLLSLHNTNVDDTGVRNICRMHELQLLDLSETDVTVAGLSVLRDCTHLRELIIAVSNVESDEVPRLRQLLPHCWIYAEPASIQTHASAN